jgi:Pentapeptide repeats (8 copies)
MKIYNKYTNKVIFEDDSLTIKETLIKANLSGANLSRADLSRANLSGANLSRAYLSVADLSRANLSRADLSRANLSRADLSRANLSRADLSGADLSRANLSGANLSGANLSEADLSGAHLSEADLSNVKNLFSQLDILLDQKGKQYAYKYVKFDYSSPINGNLIYSVGKIIIENDYETDKRLNCGRGINIASKQWCLTNMNKSIHKLLLVSYQVKDIVCIPYTTDGKFRVKKIKVEKEIII